MSSPTPSSGRLIVCPTPIGNPGDLSPRAAEALRTADVVACEDTRRTGQLMADLGVRAQLVSVHEHNEGSRVDALVARIADGARVALVSDAGMPAVSDPGFLLIGAVVDARLAMTVLPGPSAVLVAVVASALPLDRWRFVGFLPRKRGALEALVADPEPLVAFESPRRLTRSLTWLAELDPERPVAVCRELTKTYEQVVRGSAASVCAHFAENEPLGEIVVVVGQAVAREDLEAPLAAVARLVAAGAHPREAAAVVAELSGVAKNALYNAHLGN